MLVTKPLSGSVNIVTKVSVKRTFKRETDILEMVLYYMLSHQLLPLEDWKMGQSVFLSSPLKQNKTKQKYPLKHSRKLQNIYKGNCQLVDKRSKVVVICCGSSKCQCGKHQKTVPLLHLVFNKVRREEEENTHTF